MKLLKEQNQVYPLRDFHLNLLNYNGHQPINDFLDLIASNCFMPYILQPTQITDHSKRTHLTVQLYEMMYGNVTAIISDHLPPFLFVANILSNPSCKN